MEEAKPIYLSKTVWTNVILFGASFLLPKDFADQITPEILAAFFLVVNTLLRFITKEEVKLW